MEYDFAALPKEGVEADKKKEALKAIAKTFQERRETLLLCER